MNYTNNTHNVLMMWFHKAKLLYINTIIVSLFNNDIPLQNKFACSWKYKIKFQKGYLDKRVEKLHCA